MIQNICKSLNITNIRQFVIDLENDYNNVPIQEIIKNAILKLEKELDQQETKEIIELIYRCFYYFPNQPRSIFQLLNEKSRTNSNYIVLTALIASKFSSSYTNNCFLLFFEDAFQRIQYLLSKPKDQFVVFGHVISDVYKNDFIINVLMMHELDENSIILLCNYIKSDTYFSKENLKSFIDIISESFFADIIPEEFILNPKVFDYFPNKILCDRIPAMKKTNFENILPLIEAKLAIDDDKNKNLLIVVLRKCIKFNIEFKINTKMLDTITYNDIFVDDNDQIFNGNIETSYLEYVIKKIKNIQSIPSDMIKKVLLDSNDWIIYEKIFSSLINIDEIKIFSTSEFWSHLLDISLTLLNNNNVKNYSDKLMKKLGEIFTKYVLKKDVYSIFNEMIISRYPTSKNENIFILDLFNQISNNYKYVFMENCYCLITQILDMKYAPHPSFWKIVNLEAINYVFGNDDVNEMLLYAYEFAFNKNSRPKIKNLNILPYNEEKVAQFIKSGTIDNLLGFETESLSIIISAMIFTSSTEKPKINGLSIDSLFPFLAIAFIYYSTFKNGNILINVFEKMDMQDIMEFLLLNNDSPIIIASLETIISNYIYLLNPKIFPEEFAFQLLDNLIYQLIYCHYKADILTIITLIFNLSNMKPHPKISLLFQKYGISLFKTLFQKIDIIINCNQLKENKLNLKVFNSDELRDYIIETANSKFHEMIYQMIVFLVKFCVKVPKLNITNFKNLESLLKDKIEDKKIEDYLIISQFLIKHNYKENYANVPIPAKCTEQLFYKILRNNNLDNENSSFELIFNMLMKDKSIAINYFIILFQKICNNFTISPNQILKVYKKQYKSYHDQFLTALNKIFGYNINSKVFVRKIDIQNDESSLMGFSKLLIYNIYKQTKKYQSFILLKNIASSFPFIFANDPIQVFNSVLPSFNYFYLFFTIENDNQTENTINQLKTAFSALSFLHSTLYSVKILDSFVPWLYQNILNFSQSQILCFAYILYSLFNTEIIQDVVLSLSLKYNFHDIIVKLLNKENNISFSHYYKEIIYKIDIQYISLLNSLEKNSKIVYINEIKKLENSFSHEFDNCLTICPCNLAPLNIYRDNKPKILEQITEFFGKINQTKSTWITFNFSNSQKDPKNTLIEKLVSEFQKLNELKPKLNKIIQIPRIPDFKNIRMMSFLSSQPKWIYKWITNNVKFPTLQEHDMMLSKTINEMIQITNKKYNDNDDIKINSSTVSVFDYFFNEYYKIELFKLLILKSFTYDEQLFPTLYTLFKEILKNKYAMSSIFKLLKNYISNFKKKDTTPKDLRKFIRIVSAIEISSNFSFKNAFEIFGENLLDLVLYPEYRKDHLLLSNVSKLFCSCDRYFPENISNLVAFMFLTKKEDIIPQTLILCEKIGSSKLKNIMPIIIKVFNEQISKNNISYSIIKSFYEIFPSEIRKESTKIALILDRTINNYISNGYNNQNELNLIFLLFNIITPEKNTEKNDILNEDIDISKLVEKNENDNPMSNNQILLLPASQKIINTNPCFWEIYEKHRSFLIEIIKKNENNWINFKFLFDYPKLLNFRIRLNYYKDKIKKLHKDGKIYIDVNRENVFELSCAQLSKIDPSELLKKFSVGFQNEMGVDAGGLTKEWFTLIINDMFDPKHSLFECKDNNCYHPSSSLATGEQMEYFQFSGKIIAAALIHEQCINAHLTKSFLRQIINGTVKFKDLMYFDKETYNSLKSILENDVNELGFTFTIDYQVNFEMKTLTLKEKNEYENGCSKTSMDLFNKTFKRITENNVDAEIDTFSDDSDESYDNDSDDENPVTNDNKNEFVRLYADSRLRKLLINQINAFCEGFYSIMSPDLIRLFSPKELDYLICGKSKIDVSDFQKNVEYSYPYDSNHKVIKLFFEVISEWENDDLGKLLKFFTGSPLVPISGFQEYKKRGNSIRISNGGKPNNLISSHTCYNELVLPQYDDKKLMNDKLKYALNEGGENFGIM